MQNDKTQGAAILGAGFISHSHAEALRYCGIKICAVVDASEKTAADFAQKWGIKTYGTSEDLLFSDEISSVHVCTPPHTHYRIVKKLLDSGKNVLCEKPLCLDPQEAAELENLAASLNLKCGVNLNVRFHQMSDRMKGIVQDAGFGAIRLVRGQYLQQFHLLPCPYGWRYIPEIAGPMRAVTEIGTHWFDIIQYVTGKKITDVSALFGNFQPERIVRNGIMYPAGNTDSVHFSSAGDESKARSGDPDGAGSSSAKGMPVTVTSEDAALITFRLEGGAIGSVVLSEVSHGYSNYLAYEITGDRMTAGWNSQENNSVYFSTGNGQKTIESDGFGNGFNDSFRRLIQSFYSEAPDAALPVCPTFREGADIVRICSAVYKSAGEGGRWVHAG